MTTQEQILEIIQKDLPNKVGQELKKQLEELEELRAAKVGQDEAIVLLKNEIDDLNKQIQTQEQVKTRLESAITLEETNKEAERRLAVKELQLKLEAKKLALTHISQVNLSLTRNLEYRSDLFSNKPVVNKDGYLTGNMVNENSSETKTVE
jgi:hypothetical protein